MGLSPFSSSYTEPNYKYNPGNPDPSRWKIKRSVCIGHNVLVEVNYPDCTNYEGNKIILYRNCTVDLIKSQQKLDPHFVREKYLVKPFARFEPTEEGWNAGFEMLCHFAK